MSDHEYDPNCPDCRESMPQHEIEQSPRRYSKKQYSVRVLNEDGRVVEKKVRLDVTPQVRPVGISPLPFPSQAEVNARTTEEGGSVTPDLLVGALALNAMRQTPTHEQPEGDVGLLETPGVPAASPREPLTREVALQQLADYLGVNVEDIQGSDPRRGSWLADNLGTLVSSLDGTEEFVAEMLAVAKHPRFYFKEALPRARKYLAKAAKLVEDFPWEYSSSSPSDAISHLREAQGFIGYAVTAVTGRGSETPERDRYNEDGVMTRGVAFQDARESSLEWHIKSYKRLVSILEALKLKRDAMLQAGKKPDETLANNDLVEAIRTAVQESSK